MIEVKGLNKAFGDIEALSDVSFTAEDGRITGLLGPNGAGKSTTLRILYTALRPDRGRAAIDGIDVAREPLNARRRIGVLPHSPGLYPNLDARENIQYYGRLHGMSEATLDRRIDELESLLGLREFAARRAKGYSQGERIRTSIARALVHEPQNIILDEPTNGLDVMATRSLRDFIRALRKEGRCVLFSSHVMQEVAALCNHIVILSHGRVVAQGSADQLKKATGVTNLEDAFVKAIGSAEGLE